MYKLVLILRYLRRKLTPLFAALAVTLCTAMVIIVISVMGGFLDMMRDSAKRITGEVTISSDLTGFPYYEQMLEKLEQMDEVAASTAVVRSFGLINMAEQVRTVEVLGIRPEEVNHVTGYQDTLYWTKQRLGEDLEREAKQSRQSSDGKPVAPSSGELALQRMLKERWLRDATQFGMTFEPPRDWIAPPYLDPEEAAHLQPIPGIVPGIEVNPYSMRDQDGHYHRINSALGWRVTLTVLPVTKRGTVQEPSVRELMVVNEFKSGLYETDANRIYIPFDLLQRMLRMDESQMANIETGEPTGEIIPGRASEIMVRGAPGVSLAALQKAVKAAVREVIIEHPDMPQMWVQTWEERHATLLNAVEKEKGLLTILFAIISIVAVAMIGVIFYMIVLEKTRDIGILRAVGAARSGIASIFLGYGLAIGIVGAAMGLVIGAAVVWNLNEIQDVLFQWFGFKMWDPRVYYFERIPNKLDPPEVIVIVTFAVFSSVIGSLVPALLAARLDPVESLRYE